MGSLSFSHMLLLFLILVIFMGPKKLPQLGQSLGEAIRGFKEGLNEMSGEARPLPSRQDEQRPQQVAQPQGAPVQNTEHQAATTEKPQQNS